MTTDTPKDKPDSVLYMAIVNLRNAELAALWARFNLYLFANGGLMFAVVTKSLGAFASGIPDRPHISIPIFGLILSAIWLASELIGRKALAERDNKIETFERIYLLPFGFSDISSYSPIPQIMRWQGRLSIITIGAFIFAWASLIVVHFCPRCFA